MWGHRFVLSSCAAVVLAACSSTPPPADDASGSDASRHCASAADCDDHLFCDGVETCASGTCTPGSSPCTAMQTCDEASDRCAAGCATPDADGDGARAIACGGMDCDDMDPSRFPGNMEVCDVDAHDEDCDPTTFGVRDADGDGVADANCCNVDAMGTRQCGTDCDDTSASISPRSPEVCNGFDDDCDGAVDEDSTLSYSADCDGDGHGEMPGTTPPCGIAPTATGCLPPPHYASSSDDCNDADSSVYDGHTEVCDGIDNDCDVTIDESLMLHRICTDADDDHWAVDVCHDACGVGPHELDVTIDSDRDPSVLANLDCNDANATIHPHATDACDMDLNCDGVIGAGTNVYYVDCDHDGFAASATGMVMGCTVPADPPCTSPGDACSPDRAPSWTNTAPTDATTTDCNDFDHRVYPMSRYAGCFAPDVDCDGVVDPVNDADGDHWSACGCARDCDDGNAMRFPGNSEIVADGIDEDCDLMEICYQDLDADFYRTDLTTLTTDVACSSAGHARATARSGDCCDMDAGAHPGAVGWRTMLDACANGDWNCDNTVTLELPTSTTTCGLAAAFRCSGAGWSGSVPDCGVTADYTDCVYSADAGDCIDVPNTVTQACR